MFEKAPEEYFADAGQKLWLVFENLDADQYATQLPTHLQSTFVRALADAHKGAKRLKGYCDGPTAWGMAEGYGIGKKQAFEDLVAIATKESRADIVQWLGERRHEATRP